MKSAKLAFTLVIIFTMGLTLSSCVAVSNLIEGKDSDNKLYEGILSDNIEVINEAIEEGADINHIRGKMLSNSNPVWISLKHAVNNRIPEYLINRGADVNYPDNDGTSLLMYWANNTDVHFCELLIKRGAKVNEENKGYTALEYVLDHNGRDTATEKTIDSIVTMLLDHGAKIRPITLKALLTGGRGWQNITMYNIKKRILEGLLKEGYQSGLDPALEAALLGESSRLDELTKVNKIKKVDEEQILFSTAAFGSVETMKLLKEKGFDIGFKNKFKYTPLIIASLYGNLEMVKYLVGEGVDIETRTIDGNSNKSALNYAVVNNQYDTAEYLIKIGADTKPYALFVGSVDVLGEACDNGDIRMIKMILDNGYPVNDKNLFGATITVLKNKHIDVVKLFLDMGVDINKEYENTMPSMSSVTSLEGIKFLVEHGAKVDGIDGKGDPINSASAGGKTDVVKYLISKGANVNAVGDEEGQKLDSALYKAVIHGNFDIVKLLVENGADLEQQFEFGNGNYDTAVITAAGYGSKHILEYIIKAGAKVNYQNVNGETALMRAASSGRKDNVRFLIDNKSNVSLKDNEGKTAIDCARANKYIDIVNILKNSK